MQGSRAFAVIDSTGGGRTPQMRGSQVEDTETLEHLFQALDLPPSATPEMVRQAYLDLVRVWHPDRFVNDSRLQRIAEERLRTINAAYEQIQKLPCRAGPEPPTSNSGFKFTAVRRSRWHIPSFGLPAAMLVLMVVLIDGGLGLWRSLAGGTTEAGAVLAEAARRTGRSNFPAVPEVLPDWKLSLPSVQWPGQAKSAQIAAPVAAPAPPLAPPQAERPEDVRTAPRCPAFRVDPRSGVSGSAIAQLRTPSRCCAGHTGRYLRQCGFPAQQPAVLRRSGWGCTTSTGRGNPRRPKRRHFGRYGPFQSLRIDSVKESRSDHYQITLSRICAERESVLSPAGTRRQPLPN